MSSRNKVSKPTTSKKASPKTSARAKSGSSRTAYQKAEVRNDIFDETMKNDLAGVIIAVFAIALFITVLSPGDGVLTNLAANVFLYGFGVGAYVIPFALLIFGASFFTRSKTVHVWRMALGLGLLIVAVISILALFTPGATSDSMLVFTPENLVSRGGYLGAGIAWCLLKLLGRAIGTIVLVGVSITGCVFLGFSISNIVERLRMRFDRDPEDEYREPLPVQRQRSLKMPKAKQQTLVDSQGTVSNNDIYEKETLQLDAALRSSIPEKKGTPVVKNVAGHVVKAHSEPRAMEGFELPPLTMLNTSSSSAKRTKAEQSELKEVAQGLQRTLNDFNLDARVVGWVDGPTFTMFKVEMPAGVHLTKITGLQNDIALALAADSVRIFAPIPGTSLVGIEIPNKTRASVLLGDVLAHVKGGPLVLGIGKDVEGDTIVADLAKMPHLLIGGTTGSGKSVALNSMLMSILMRATPAEVRMILIDPKRVELSIYNGIPHLFVPVVTDPKEAAAVLAWATIEMDRRLKVFEKAQAKDIGIYNSKVQTGEVGEEATELPYMVIVIDELSDLMMVMGKEVEGSIVRIAQLARAVGIHLIVATQRPSSNVVTGMIKANIVNRIAFKVATVIDSRVVLDQPGAEKLIGLGDLLFLTGDAGKPKRIQGCYVSDDEINETVNHLKAQGEPDYHTEVLATHVNVGGGGHSLYGDDSGDDDPRIWEAAEIVVASQLGSTSNIQRRLKVGYSRAGRIMDQLHDKGIVGPPDGSRPREVLVDTMELETLKAFESYDAENDQ